MTLIAERPNSPIRQRAEFGCDVLRSDDGTENRLAFRAAPRESWLMEWDLLGDDDLRVWRERLVTAPAGSVTIPIWPDYVAVTASAAAGQAVVSGNFAESDINDGDAVLVYSTARQTHEEAVVLTRADAQVTLTSNLGATYARGSLVLPLQEGLLAGPAQGSLGVLRGDRLGLEILLQPRRRFSGLSGIVPQYQNLPAVDERPLAPEAAAWPGDERTLETANSAAQRSGLAQRDTSYQRRFVYQDAQGRQRWKNLLNQVAGRQSPLFLPTWRADLVLSAQPAAGGSQIVVLDLPDWDASYKFDPTKADLQLETADGIIRRRVTASTPGAGVTTLTLDSALPDPLDPILVVSFLEQCRLDSDTVEFVHRHSHTEVSLEFRTVAA